MMRLKKLWVLLMFFTLAAIPLGCLTNNKTTRPAPVRKTQQYRPMVNAFYVNDPGGFDSLPSLKAHRDMLDEISPLWYHVRPDGSIQEEPNQEAIAFCKRNRIRISPLINVVPNQDTVLRDRRARANAIANIVRIVKKYDFNGANIDFEFVPSTGRTDFRIDKTEMSQFMSTLNAEFKKMGKYTHMAVLPVVGVSPEMSGVYDYSALSRVVDKVTIMCYDHSQEGSPPGPLAPFHWVRQNIVTAIKQGFKPSQICLGVATYGYDWPAGKSGGFSSPSKEIIRKAAIRGHEVKWSDRHQEPYYIYRDANGVTREVWFENSATLQTKIQLANQFKLSGIRIWRLGFEDPRFWATLEKNWGKKR